MCLVSIVAFKGGNACRMDRSSARRIDARHKQRGMNTLRPRDSEGAGGALGAEGAEGTEAVHGGRRGEGSQGIRQAQGPREACEAAYIYI